MHRAELLGTLGLVVVLSTAVGIALGAFGRHDAPARAEKTPRLALAALTHPLAQFFFVCGIVFVNQILFDAYVLRVHHGDATFIGRYLGHGWFAIARHDPIVRFVAAHVGAGEWLSPTVLRVQAFLELPWTLFAYLAVARMLGVGVLRRLVRPATMLAASVSFSITFSLVELWVANPYTHDDLWLRALSAIVTPLYVIAVVRAHLRYGMLDDETDPSRERGLLGLLAFLAGAGAVATIVLALYDAFLLYNLAHLATYARSLVAAAAIAVAASFAAPRVDRIAARILGRRTSPSIDAAYSALAAFTGIFFVPSLSLRYGATLPTSVLAGFALVVIAFALGLRAAMKRRPIGLGATVALFVSLVVGIVSGVAAAALAVWAAGPAPLPELTLARASMAFLGSAFVSMRLAEVVAMALCSRPDEAEAQVDEA